MDSKHNDTAYGDHGTHCAGVPELKRLRYFYGQMLGVHDFQSEQNYFRDKLKLHNRCLHGYGTVCGLMVVPKPRDADCVPETDSARAEIEVALKNITAEIKELERNRDEAQARLEQAEKKGDSDAVAKLSRDLEAINKRLEQRRGEAEDHRRRLETLPKPSGDCKPEQPTQVTLECGFALDCEGNEIIVRRDFDVDLWQYLSADDRKRVEGGAQTLYVSLCYCEQPVDPVRPVLQDACGAAAECTYSKVRDAFRVLVSVDQLRHDTRCETCCEPCDEPCLLLARIDRFRRSSAVARTDIDNSVRRLIGLYTATTITGVSWSHGAVYSEVAAQNILGNRRRTKGLRVTFSRPVLTSTLTRGVIDLWVLQGGDTRSGDIYHLGGEFVDLDLATPTTSEFRYRYTGREDLDPGDRVLITIRCAFILDECCRPVDGTHVGGRVAMLPDDEFKEFRRDRQFPRCVTRPPGYGALWTSGAGTPGTSFESWFYVEGKETEEIDT